MKDLHGIKSYEEDSSNEEDGSEIYLETYSKLQSLFIEIKLKEEERKE